MVRCSPRTATMRLHVISRGFASLPRFAARGAVRALYPGIFAFNTTYTNDPGPGEMDPLCGERPRFFGASLVLGRARRRDPRSRAPRRRRALEESLVSDWRRDLTVLVRFPARGRSRRVLLRLGLGVGLARRRWLLWRWRGCGPHRVRNGAATDGRRPVRAPG
jgi:hypothetical protein